MKKTILLALALAAGFLTMRGAARRDNNKHGDITIIRHFFAAAILAGFAVLLTACGGKTEQYYQYKEGESNVYAADAKCRQYADRTVSADDVTTDSLHQQRFGIDFIQYEPAAPADSR